jgi:hypothetical protein
LAAAKDECWIGDIAAVQRGYALVVFAAAAAWAKEVVKADFGGLETSTLCFVSCY